jgi:hypothetical protein
MVNPTETSRPAGVPLFLYHLVVSMKAKSVQSRIMPAQAAAVNLRSQAPSSSFLKLGAFFYACTSTGVRRTITIAY